MLKNVIIALVFFVLVGFIVVWALSGGPRKVWEGVQLNIERATSTQGYVLPWQPNNLFPTMTEEDLYGGSLPEGYEGFEKEFGQDGATLGDPSPRFGHVRIREYGSSPKSDAAGEHLVIEAGSDNTSPVALLGWSLQSAVTGLRVPLPEATPLLIAGTVNTLEPVSLSPGAQAIVFSGVSPVGGSFRENVCSAYLGQFQTFIPALSGSCPSPADDLPLTAENISMYGGNCIDYVRTLTSCQLPRDVPAELSASCRTFLTTQYSYNGCVNMHREDPGFSSQSWRLFIGAARELWLNDHDVIRLLDEEGRIVDVYTY